MTNLSTDARVVLAYLNELGYRNITAEQLKEFIKDLRKLIKYEDLLEVGNSKTENNAGNQFNSLHKTTTASYRAKLPPENEKNIHKVKQKETSIFKHPAVILKSTNKLNKKSSTKSIDTNKQRSGCSLERPTSSKMWIRTAPSKPNHLYKSGPVELYQYYKNEWEKFKVNLPGENSHSELRWKIRQKLLGEHQPQDKT